MAVDQRVKAGKIWPLLVQAAVAKSKMTYGELAPRVGIFQRNLGLPLDIIAKHCKRNAWPPLTAVVVTTDTGTPVGLDGEDPEGAYKRVYEFDWTKVKNPFELFATTA